MAEEKQEFEWVTSDNFGKEQSGSELLIERLRKLKDIAKKDYIIKIGSIKICSDGSKIRRKNGY